MSSAATPSADAEQTHRVVDWNQLLIALSAHGPPRLTLLKQLRLQRGRSWTPEVEEVCQHVAGYAREALTAVDLEHSPAIADRSTCSVLVEFALLRNVIPVLLELLSEACACLRSPPGPAPDQLRRALSLQIITDGAIVSALVRMALWADPATTARVRDALLAPLPGSGAPGLAGWPAPLASQLQQPAAAAFNPRTLQRTCSVFTLLVALLSRATYSGDLLGWVPGTTLADVSQHLAVRPLLDLVDSLHFFSSGPVDPDHHPTFQVSAEQLVGAGAAQDACALLLSAAQGASGTAAAAQAPGGAPVNASSSAGASGSGSSSSSSSSSSSRAGAESWWRLAADYEGLSCDVLHCYIFPGAARTVLPCLLAAWTYRQRTAALEMLQSRASSSGRATPSTSAAQPAPGPFAVPACSWWVPVLCAPAPEASRGSAAGASRRAGPHANQQRRQEQQSVLTTPGIVKTLGRAAGRRGMKPAERLGCALLLALHLQAAPAEVHAAFLVCTYGEAVLSGVVQALQELPPSLDAANALLMHWGSPVADMLQQLQQTVCTATTTPTPHCFAPTTVDTGALLLGLLLLRPLEEQQQQRRQRRPGWLPECSPEYVEYVAAAQRAGFQAAGGDQLALLQLGLFSPPILMRACSSHAMGLVPGFTVTPLLFVCLESLLRLQAQRARGTTTAAVLADIVCRSLATDSTAWVVWTMEQAIIPVAHSSSRNSSSSRSSSSSRGSHSSTVVTSISSSMSAIAATCAAFAISAVKLTCLVNAGLIHPAVSSTTAISVLQMLAQALRSLSLPGSSSSSSGSSRTAAARRAGTSSGTALGSAAQHAEQRHARLLLWGGVQKVARLAPVPCLLVASSPSTGCSSILVVSSQLLATMLGLLDWLPAALTPAPAAPTPHGSAGGAAAVGVRRELQELLQASTAMSSGSSDAVLHQDLTGPLAALQECTELFRPAEAPLYLAACHAPDCANLAGASEAGLVANGRGVVCGGCGVVRYCSRACFERDWAGRASSSHDRHQLHCRHMACSRRQQQEAAAGAARRRQEQQEQHE